MASRLTLRSSAALVSLSAFLLQTAPWPVLHAWHLAPARTSPLPAGAASEVSSAASRGRAIGAVSAAAEHGAACAVCAAVAHTRSAAPASAPSTETGLPNLGAPADVPEAHPPLVELATAAARAPPVPVS